MKKKCGNSLKTLSRYDDISFSSLASHFRHQWQNEFANMKKTSSRTHTKKQDEEMRAHINTAEIDQRHACDHLC